MKLKRRNLSVIISALGILVGSLFLLFERFLDGSIFNPVDIIRQPAIIDPFDFTPLSMTAVAGEIVGGYQVSTDRTDYAVGDTIYIVMTFCHKRNLQSVTQWTFLNSEITTLVAKKPSENLKVDCYSDKKIEVGKIPPSLALTKSGTLYQLKGTINYSVNPIRRISYVLLSNSFVVKH